MNASLDKLAKNLPDKDFKYSIEEFCSKNVELLKQNGAFSYEYMDSFERINEEKLAAKNIFIVLQKMGKLVMMVKYQTVT